MDKVALIELNRPEALNALCSELMVELSAQLETLAKDESIGAVVITGSQKTFAGIKFMAWICSYTVAGADITEMANRTFSDNYKENFLADWNLIFKTFPKPIIAAVNGYAVLF
jgi:enoyl-CoA hydratase